MYTPKPSGNSANTLTKIRAGLMSVSPVLVVRRACAPALGWPRCQPRRPARAGARSAVPFASVMPVRSSSLTLIPSVPPTARPGARNGRPRSALHAIECGLDICLALLECGVDIAAVDGLFEHLEPGRARLVVDGVIGQRVLDRSLGQSLERHGVERELSRERRGQDVSADRGFAYGRVLLLLRGLEHPLDELPGAGGVRGAGRDHEVVAAVEGAIAAAA